MRLYTLTGATQVDDPQYGRFTVNDSGAFDGLPEALANRLHSFHLNGKPAWEDDAERERRIVAEELDRMRDPATLLAAIKEQGASHDAVMAALAAALGIGAVTAPAAAADATPAAVPVAEELPAAPDDTPSETAPAAPAKRRGRPAAASKTSAPAE